MFLAGSTITEILEEVVKQDGEPPHRNTVARAIRACQKSGGMSFTSCNQPYLHSIAPVFTHGMDMQTTGEKRACNH